MASSVSFNGDDEDPDVGKSLERLLIVVALALLVLGMSYAGYWLVVTW